MNFPPFFQTRRNLERASGTPWQATTPVLSSILPMAQRSQLTFEDEDPLLALERSWETVLRRLDAEVQPHWMERFIRPLQPVSWHEGTVTIEVPGRFVHDWVRERYLKTISEMLSDELGARVEVELRAEARERRAAPTPLADAILPAAPEGAFNPSERFTFETYVQGQSNRLAFAGAKAVAQDPGGKFNPLFIYGPSGLGKTHLLHAIAHEIHANQPRFPLVYVSAQQFAEEFVQALQNNRIDQFRRAQRSVGVWLVDDIQFLAGKDKTSEELFHTFNHLQSLGKQIVLTSDKPPRDLYLMDERLRSRFEAGLVADVQMPDTETRIAILRSKAEGERIELPFDVAVHLAERVPGNIRALEGALTKLITLASLEGGAPTLDVAKGMVDQYYRTAVVAKPGFEQIVGTVGAHFKISSDEIKGTSRKAPIVHARHVAVHITRDITGDSWKHIGSLFGDRDHTSMMHGHQKIQLMMKDDPDLAATIKMLKKTLYPEA